MTHISPCTCYASYLSPSVARRKGYEYDIKHCPLHAAAPKLLAALEAVEAVSANYDDMLPHCPVCRYFDGEHTADCQLHTALKSARGDEPTTQENI